jgi:hypothetical protein
MRRVSLNPISLDWLEAEIADSTKNLEKAQQAEIENDYDDALLSMERKYEEGFVDALEYVKNHLTKGASA